MSGVKNLLSVSKEEIKSFLDSFDYVFFDIDGVLMLGPQPLPGSDTCVKALRNLKKDIVAVTNNTATSMEHLVSVLNPLYDFTKETIVTPQRAIIEYLKKINFQRSLMVIGSEGSKAALREAGFKIVHFEPEKIDETPGSIRKDVQQVRQTTEDVGAIILDMDFNFQLLQAQRAIILLSSRDNILLLEGMSDFSFPINRDVKLLGSKFFQDAVKTITQRESIKFAKPSQKLRETLNCDFNITDPKRVLFVGDTISNDMAFASMCGYQKLLVLTGSTKQNDLDNWSYPEDLKPHYYLNSLQDFCDVL